MKTNENIQVIIEKNDNELWGRIEGFGDFMPVVVGKSRLDVLENLKTLVKDYLANEGKMDMAWQGINLDAVHYQFNYDVQAFFAEFDFLNQTKIAEIAGINPALLRQYASGVKHPSKEQALKIETAIHNVSKELQAASVYAD